MRCQILFYSNIHMAFTNSTLIFLESEALPGTNLDIQYFLVGDEMFPLKNWHQHPYKSKLLQLPEMIYNYRHSRARRVIKNTFRVLRACWKIFSHRIKASVQNTDSDVMACLCLHTTIFTKPKTLCTHFKALLMSN